MTFSPTPLLRSAVALRLRQAGCVFAEEETELLLATARTVAELEAMIVRRTGGEPLEHVLGWADFCGLRIFVEPGVFIPRRRTEFLVRCATGLARPGAVVVDLCCGSGAVGAALATAVEGAELHAADVDPAAVRCARRNLAPLGGRVHQGDLFAPLPAHLRGRITLLAANTPYVPTGEIPLLPPEARLHEPRTALDGGPDGLDLQRRLAAEAAAWLAPGGHLLVEATARQAPETAAVFLAHGLNAEITTSEDLDTAVITATR
ncbi:putative protein N(5)-glutamine methyltransferase [Streptomyces sp. YIM 98790]|uniref:putative protein N(5)-glutamine methyltransferase n=1 Tax=Streptomyces sp. YIM 98790 TaxID=2689077 RepID=UPI001409E681|nr:putative protein N(5)-glutamine methyltransferase [Streptomyces sp. YIM 98790]